jgi:hypothetical protein
MTGDKSPDNNLSDSLSSNNSDQSSKKKPFANEPDIMALKDDV